MTLPTPASPVRDDNLDRDAVEAGLRQYLETVVRAGRFDLRFQVRWQDPAADGELETPDVVITFDGPDRDLLLEHGGELLKALEYVGVRWLRLDPKLHDRVRFDCGNYRADRLAELKLSARVAADQVRESHLPFRFNPMSSRERRIVHLVLKDQPGIRTASEGVGESRRLVVFPADAK